jgi:hypothetical protein
VFPSIVMPEGAQPRVAPDKPGPHRAGDRRNNVDLGWLDIICLGPRLRRQRRRRIGRDRRPPIEDCRDREIAGAIAEGAENVRNDFDRDQDAKQFDRHAKR